jgi:hypothetical protein
MAPERSLIRVGWERMIEVRVPVAVDICGNHDQRAATVLKLKAFCRSCSSRHWSVDAVLCGVLLRL